MLKDQPLERLSIHVIQEHENLAIFSLQPVKADDIRMLQFLQGLGLAPETADENTVNGQFVVQHLHSQVDCPQLIPHFIDLGHAPATN